MTTKGKLIIAIAVLFAIGATFFSGAWWEKSRLTPKQVEGTINSGQISAIAHDIPAKVETVKVVQTPIVKVVYRATSSDLPANEIDDFPTIQYSADTTLHLPVLNSFIDDKGNKSLDTGTVHVRLRAIFEQPGNLFTLLSADIQPLTFHERYFKYETPEPIKLPSLELFWGEASVYNNGGDLALGFRSIGLIGGCDFHDKTLTTKYGIRFHHSF